MYYLIIEREQTKRKRRIEGSGSSVGQQMAALDAPFLPSAQAQKLIDSYSDLARASVQQMSSLSQRVQSLQQLSGWPSSSSDVPQLTGPEEGSSSQTNNESSFSLPTSSAAGSSGSNWATASNVNVSQPPIELMLPERGSAETINLGASAPRKTADGLTVVTVGHLAPKNTPPGTFGYPVLNSTNSSQETSMASASGAGNGKVRVHRTTYVPGWSVPPRVLLVDDDSVFRNLSSKLLQVFGCTFDVAADGVEAMHKLGLEKYDIVLMVSLISTLEP